MGKFILQTKLPMRLPFLEEEILIWKYWDFPYPKTDNIVYWHIYSTKNKPRRKKTILFSSISPDWNISVMVLQNFTRALIDVVVNNRWVIILYGYNFKKFFTILCGEDFEIFSAWAIFLMVKFEFSEKYFSTSSTVSSVTTVYEEPWASYLRSWRVPYWIKLSIVL